MRDHFRDLYPNLYGDHPLLPPITSFFRGTSVSAYDIGVFSSLTFSGSDVVNIANRLAPGSYDIDCSATPVQYLSTGLDGRPCIDTNGVDEAGTANFTGAGLTAGDQTSYHAVYVTKSNDGSTGWLVPDQTGGEYLRSTGTSSIMQTSAGATTYDTVQFGTPRADEMELNTTTGARVRRNGGSWNTSTDMSGLQSTNPVMVVSRVGAQYELIKLAALVVAKNATVAQMDAWLTGYVAPRFSTIRAALP